MSGGTITALAMLLSACGGSGTPSNPETTEPETVTATTTQPATYAQILQNLTSPGGVNYHDYPCLPENLEIVQRAILNLTDPLDRANLTLQLISNWDQFCDESEDQELERIVNTLIGVGLYNVLGEDGRPKYENLGTDINGLLERRLALAIDAGDNPDAEWQRFNADVERLFAEIESMREDQRTETKTPKTAVSTLA